MIGHSLRLHRANRRRCLAPDDPNMGALALRGAGRGINVRQQAALVGSVLNKAVALACAIVTGALSWLVALVAAHFRYGHAELGSNDTFLIWSMLVLGLASCVILSRLWKWSADPDRPLSKPS
jgi:hypothetical protein